MQIFWSCWKKTNIYMKSIYTLTLSPAIDKSSTVEQVMAEHKLRCSVPTYQPGGGGINVSRAIKKLGGDSVAIYPKGGPTGDLLKKLLDDEKITQHCIDSQSWTRENFIVVETLSGRQFRFGMPGPELLESEWQQFLDDIASPFHNIDYMVASGSTPPGVPDDFYARLARVVHQKNAKLVLDTSGEALKHAVAEGVYLLKPNLKELSDLVGKELNSIQEQEEAALEIANKYNIEILVVSLGPAGALLASQNKTMQVGAPSVAMKSTVGAGDSMVAGMVLSLANDHSLIETLKYGIAAGTAATMNFGTELCKLEDVNKLYQWMQSH